MTVVVVMVFSNWTCVRFPLYFYASGCARWYWQALYWICMKDRSSGHWHEVSSGTQADSNLETKRQVPGVLCRIWEQNSRYLLLGCWYLLLNCWYQVIVLQRNPANSKIVISLRVLINQINIPNSIELQVNVNAQVNAFCHWATQYVNFTVKSNNIGKGYWHKLDSMRIH